MMIDWFPLPTVASADPDDDDPGDRNITIARVISSLLSFLSMCGAMLIILSYICFRDVRTKAREVLCNLSLADFGVGCSNLIGAIVHLGPYIHKCHEPGWNSTLSGYPVSCDVYNNLCKAQAFFGSYCTIASFLWSMLLALYIYTLVLDSGRWLAYRLVWFGYVFCWGMAALVSLWLVLTRKLGYTRYGGGGWCAIRVETKARTIDDDETILINRYNVIFAVNLWSVVTFIMVLVLYTATHVYIRIKKKEFEDNSFYSHLSVQSSDRKFLLIPVAFLLLRLGGIVFSVCYIYTNWWSSLPYSVHIIIYFAMAFGASGQGMVNGVLFCFLTPRIRKKICFCCRVSKKTRDKRFDSSLVFSENHEQRRLLEKIISSTSTQVVSYMSPPSSPLSTDSS